MTWFASGTFIFGVFAAVAQIALGLVLLLRSPRSARVGTIAVLFIVNGVISALWAFLTGVPELFDGIVGNHSRITEAMTSTAGSLDLGTNLIILMFALIYPRPGRFKTLDQSWPVWVLACLLAPFVLSLATPYPVNTLRATSISVDTAALLLGFIPFEITFIVLLVRWTRLWRQEQPPVLREQFALIFAAFGLRAAHLLVLIPANLPAKLIAGKTWTDPALFLWAMTCTAMVLALLWSLYQMWPRTDESPWLRRRTTFVLAFLLLGVAEGIVNTVLLFSHTFHWWGSLSGRLDVMMVRPILIWFAITRTQFIDVKWRSDQAAATIVAIFTGGGFMAGVFDSISGNVSTWIAWVISGLVGAGMAALGAYATMAVLRNDDTSALPPTNLATYAAAIDEAYRNGAPRGWEVDRLRRMRDAMNVTGEQHAAMVAGVTTFRKAPDWRPGSTLLGRYELEQDLSGGGQSLTWRANDLLDGSQVVLKLARSELERDSLEREQATLRRLGHPHIVRPLRLERIHEAPLLVLPWYPQGTLQGIQLDKAATTQVVTDLLGALGAAHAQGVIHGDIKPSNILRDGAKSVLTDFGASITTPQGIGWTQVTMPARGTPRFSAPEVLDGAAPTPQSDLYSLGLVALELLGHHPVRADVPSHQLMRPMRELQATIPQPLPPGLRDFLAAVLQADPTKRPSIASPALVS